MIALAPEKRTPLQSLLDFGVEQKHALFGIATAFAGQGTLVVSGILVARLLGSESRGQLALLVIFPLVASQLGSLGIPASTTYHIARYRASTAEIVRSLWLPLAAISAILSIAHVLVLLLFIGPASRSVLIAGLILVPSTTGWIFHTFGLAVLQGQMRFRAFNMLRLLQPVLYSACTVVVFVAGASLPVIAVISTLSLVLSCAVVLTAAWRDPHPGTQPSIVPSRSEIIRFGIRSLAGSVNPFENFNLDQVAVGIAAGPASLGLYVVASSCTNLPRFVGQSIGLVAYPKIAHNRQKVARTICSYLVLCFAACGSIVAALELLAPVMMPFLFGRSFGASVGLTRILLLSVMAFSLRRVLSDCARGIGRPDSASLAEVVSWAVLVPVLFVVGPRFGAQGVAWVMVALPSLSFAILALLLVKHAGSTAEIDALPGETVLIGDAA